ncbi:deoxyribodipyrimidine photolyase [Bordetella avium]|nr:deoxyribodipyrimidine photolyase [Bordetella avium]AZY52337.1 deoxyribodipyrimidine photolyase [Bordetella avium]RIQ18095.1 deoxyribodipyrimidine photolyase [Bordetella avium]RIQ36567.1 deoxyribodipyrimidine photolyase [Bordetella avium]RIQ68090.1 deoxyribodipyrimidine photolyase [Bordetella avium]
MLPSMPKDDFPPTREAALARVAAFDPAAYALTRNHLDGAVSRLSPYLTHGLLSLPELLGLNLQRDTQGFLNAVQHRWVMELGWRAYFQHVWDARGDDIFASLRPGPRPDEAYATEMPPDICEARTGLPVIDLAVRTLYASGYLHNHARLWLASYVVHARQVHWRCAADWLLGHLLDGDLGSNHLSWQWVAGTASAKPYLFNAENVARFAPEAWHSPGTPIDAPYERLDAMARGLAPWTEASGGAGMAPPGLTGHPPWLCKPPPAEVVRGRSVWLVHPWALGELPDDMPADRLCVGWWPQPYHLRWPWSERRWRFVATRMGAVAAYDCYGDGASLLRLLQGARDIQTLSNPHVRHLLPAAVRQRPAPTLFPVLEQSCRSFSAWWKLSTQGIRRTADLPGLRAWQEGLR